MTRRPIVYSTQHGSLCPDCNEPLDRCRCRAKASGGREGVVYVRRSTQGRKGSGVTLVEGAPLGAAELKKLGKELKKKCGSGGTVKDGVIEIQGEHRDAIVAALQAKGWDVRRAGG